MARLSRRRAGNRGLARAGRRAVDVTGLRYGYGAALRAITGLQIALLLQLCVVALGLGAVLATSETAFAVVKFAGAAYLIWLGVQKWRSPPEPIGGTARRCACSRAASSTPRASW